MTFVMKIQKANDHSDEIQVEIENDGRKWKVVPSLIDHAAFKTCYESVDLVNNTIG